jgi:hypothetical protein
MRYQISNGEIQIWRYGKHDILDSCILVGLIVVFMICVFVIYLGLYVCEWKCWYSQVYVWLCVATPEVRLEIPDLQFYWYVLNLSHPVALEGSSKYATELVERFIRKYTKLSPVFVEHDYKFSRLAVNSRLEITIVGKPSGFQTPIQSLYNFKN